MFDIKIKLKTSTKSIETFYNSAKVKYKPSNYVATYVEIISNYVYFVKFPILVSEWQHFESLKYKFLYNFKCFFLLEHCKT